MATKVCSGCKQALPLGAFYKATRTYDGLQAYCKPCNRKAAKARSRRLGAAANTAVHKAWQVKHPRAVMDGHYRRKYGITHDDYTTMVLAQDGQCAICHEVPPKLYVDHDHATGQVRKLLCRDCNTLLGLAKDNPYILDRGSDYLRGARHGLEIPHAQ